MAPIDSLEHPPHHDPLEAWRFRDFRLLCVGSFVSALGSQMVSVAIGWELYERTNSALDLGLVGLVQVIPILLLSLPAGQIADRFNRKRIVLMSQLLLSLCSLGLALLSYLQGPLPLVYGCLALIGVARAFNSPASTTLLPQTVPPAKYANAITWSSSSSQLASVLGPALGGFIIAWSRPASVYLLDVVAALTYVLLLTAIRGRHIAQSSEAATLRTLFAGFGFVRQTKVLLAAITLDLFAVLLGGAVTLLPIFARDILHVGPSGLGWLRAAPSLGAVLMAMSIAYLPPFKRAGRTLLLAVAGFGAATIIFGLSQSFYLSLLMLALLGAFDSISVVIRSSLVLMRTPEEMLGRVSAINGIFISTSNELGGFESGLAAALLGPIIAVVGGGVGTILVVIAVMFIWPEMRRLGKLTPT